MNSGHVVAGVVGGVLVVIYILFLSDQRLTHGQWQAYRHIFGQPPSNGDPGVSWGIWVLVVGGVLVTIGIWPLLTS